MKIKNIFLSLGLGLAGVAGFTSCDSLFRDFPNDKLPAEVIWEDPCCLTNMYCHGTVIWIAVSIHM